MELREIINKIVEKKFSALPETRRPAALAKLLDIGETDARRLMVAGRNQEKQFQIFLRLMPICEDMGINPAQQSQRPPSRIQATGGDHVEQRIAKRLAGAIKEFAPKKKK